LEEYDLISNKDSSTVLTYFAVTTLTTIGLGDYHPQSNFERILATLLMVGGVGTFSLILEKVNCAIIKFRNFYNPLEE
jgi:hypothetical protein